MIVYKIVVRGSRGMAIVIKREQKRYILKDQIKAKDIFIDFDHLRPGDFKISNEISI